VSRRGKERTLRHTKRRRLLLASADIPRTDPRPTSSAHLHRRHAGPLPARERARRRVLPALIQQATRQCFSRRQFALHQQINLASLFINDHATVHAKRSRLAQHAARLLPHSIHRRRLSHKCWHITTFARWPSINVGPLLACKRLQHTSLLNTSLQRKMAPSTHQHRAHEARELMRNLPPQTANRLIVEPHTINSVPTRRRDDMRVVKAGTSTSSSPSHLIVHDPPPAASTAYIRHYGEGHLTKVVDALHIHTAMQTIVSEISVQRGRRPGVPFQLFRYALPTH
jgi:hypothetical protein